MNTTINKAIENCTASIMLRIIDDLGRRILSAGAVPPPKKYIQEIIREEVSSIYAIAAAEEREACARVVETWHIKKGGYGNLAAAIAQSSRQLAEYFGQLEANK